MEDFEEFREYCETIKTAIQTQIDSQMCFVGAMDIIWLEVLKKMDDNDTDKQRAATLFASARNGIVDSARSMGKVFNLEIILPENIAKKARQNRDDIDTLESWFALDPDKDAVRT